MLKPLHDRIIVKRTEQQEKTAGGLYIPDSSKEKTPEGVVVAVGPGLPDGNGSWTDMTVSVDDVVVFGRHAGIEVKDGEETYVILKESDVLAVRA